MKINEKTVFRFIDVEENENEMKGWMNDECYTQLNS